MRKFGLGVFQLFDEGSFDKASLTQVPAMVYVTLPSKFPQYGYATLPVLKMFRQYFH